MIVCKDARKIKWSQRATLVYADPPTNRGMNEGASCDTLPDILYQQFALDWLTNSILQLDYNGRLIICLYHKLRSLYERLITYNFSWLKYETEIIWNYGFGLYTNRTVVPSHDNILVFKTGKPPYNWLNVAEESQRLRVGDARANPLGRNVGSVWNIPRVPGNSDDRHFVRGPRRSCQPLELCQRILLLFTDPHNVVHDMFVGSGTMAKAAQITARNYFGCDICPEYVEEVKKRLAYKGKDFEPIK